MEVDDFQTCGETSVEESAVRSDDKRLPVPRCGQRKEIEEEVDRMHMDHVRSLDVTQHLGRNRIPMRSSIGDAHDLDAVDIFMFGQNDVGLCEVAIECDHLHPLACLELGLRKIVNDIL